MKKAPTTHRAPKRAKPDHDRFDYLFTQLQMEKGILPSFYALASQDGMKPDEALMTMIRWAVSQGTLCPITEANQVLVPELEALHRQLTQTLRSVKIRVDADKWKGEAA